MTARHIGTKTTIMENSMSKRLVDVSNLLLSKWFNIKVTVYSLFTEGRDY